jgi:phosphatidylinositol glycan class B
LATYQDQTDVFFDSPEGYFIRYFPAKVDPLFPLSPLPTSIPGAPAPFLSKSGRYPWIHEWPQHLVFFGALLEARGVKELLEEKGYREVWNSGRKWEGEGHRKGGVKVWKWTESHTK